MAFKQLAIAAGSLATVTASLFTVAVPAQAASVTATSYVNLIDGPNIVTDVGLNPSASSSAGGGGGSAIASAGPTASLRAFANSENSILSTPAGASAGFGLNYVLAGNPNAAFIPLTFNFNLSGGLNASVDVTNTGSVASANFQYLIIDTASSNVGGSSSLTLQGRQAPLFFSSGTLGDTGNGGRLGARVTPVLNIQGTVNVEGEKIRAEDFQDLGETPAEKALFATVGKFLTTDIPLEQFRTETSFLNGAIINAISSFGLPRLNIPAGKVLGADIDLGFDTEFFFNTNVQLTRQVQDKGFLIGSLTTSAATSPFDANASSNFGSTLKLTSITVPQSFNAVDVSNLKVMFDSGQVFDVIRESNPTPVPTPALLPGLIGFGLNMFRKRKQLQQKQLC
ncbi:MAG: PTPA-CTERM sorting domain-containing protein [Stenomitos rutilans HA7619-LM2]|jgi:hypothetical protein|nr:PTPA-CTERM sorting domain-containing protein [Stenomitos rutilans HA7619-LM2]